MNSFYNCYIITILYNILNHDNPSNLAASSISLGRSIMNDLNKNIANGNPKPI